jgi:hypothetical protein
MNSEQMKQYGQIVAKCWADPGFKASLLADPRTALAAEGIEVPAGMDLRVVENTADVTYVVLPMAPAEGELSDEDLGGVIGAGNSTCGDL